MTSSFSSKNTVSSNKKLPFSINKSAFSKWINALYLGNEIAVLQTLFLTLQTLNCKEVELELRLFFHQKLAGLAEQLSKQLQETYKSSHFPFSEQDQLKVELSASCAKEIAKGYSLLCENKEFDTTDMFSQQQKALILYSGIKAQADVLLYKSIIYERPGEGFWHLCFLFYLFARNNNLLSLEIENDACFINTFKQILVFELSNTQQFDTEEMISVFYLLNKFSNKVQLLTKVPEKKYRGVPYINLREDSPPALPKDKSHRQQSELFYISSVNVIKQLFKLSKNKKTLGQYNKSTLLRLTKTLTMNKQRKSERELVDGDLYAILGFDQIKEFLLKKEKAVPQQTEPVPEKKLNLNFGILKDIESTDIWSSSGKKSKKQDIKQEIEIYSNVELIDKSSTGFSLRLIDKEAATKVGDIIGLMIAESIVITVVRRIVQAQENKVMVGVEILGKDVEILHILDLESEDSVIAFYLKSQEDIESIIIEQNDFKNEDEIFADYKNGIIRYRVEKQLNDSAMLRHLKVSVV